MNNISPTIVKSLKWSAFAAEIFLLWVLGNTLFLVPSKLTSSYLTIVGMAALFAAASAFLSGKIFISQIGSETPSYARLVATPPVLIWLCAMAVVLPLFLFRLLGTR